MVNHLQRMVMLVAINRVHGFSYNVRSARDVKGWSQERLAQEAGVSQTTIDKIERGETKRSRFAPEIARALGIAVADIYKTTTSTELTPEEAEEWGFWRPSKGETVTLIYATDGNKNDLHFSRDPVRMVAIPSQMQNYIDVVGIILLSKMMSPEFEKGDLLYVTGDEPPQLHRAIFLVNKRDEFISGVFGRLVHFDDNTWRIVRWYGKASVTDAKLEEISRTDYPTHFVVVERVLWS